MTALKPDAVFEVPGAPDWIAIGESVWISIYPRNTVARLDPKSNKGEIAFGEGSVWITSFEFPISRIDPTLGKVVQQFAGEGGDAIRVGLGSVWLSNIRAGTVGRLDPRRIAATVAQ